MTDLQFAVMRTVANTGPIAQGLLRWPDCQDDAGRDVDIGWKTINSLLRRGYLERVSGLRIGITQAGRERLEAHR